MFAKFGDRVVGALLGHLDFVKKAFSDNGTPSSSRLLAALCTVVSAFCLLFVVIKTHIIPDATVTSGLAAFGTAHYAVNRVSNMFGGQKRDQSGGNADTAAQVANDKDK